MLNVEVLVGMEDPLAGESGRLSRIGVSLPYNLLLLLTVSETFGVISIKYSPAVVA